MFKQDGNQQQNHIGFLEHEPEWRYSKRWPWTPPYWTKLHGSMAVSRTPGVSEWEGEMVVNVNVWSSEPKINHILSWALVRLDDHVKGVKHDDSDIHVYIYVYRFTYTLLHYSKNKRICIYIYTPIYIYVLMKPEGIKDVWPSPRWFQAPRR